jgi:hypothetical protein
MAIQWLDYQPKGPWYARYRILNNLLEIELETFSRSAPETNFVFDVDNFSPPRYEIDVESVQLSVVDSYVGERIWMGGRVPGHWKRSVSLVVPVYPEGVVPCA